MRIAIAALMFLLTPPALAADPLYAIRTGPESSQLKALPNSAEDASARYGDVPIARSDATYEALRAVIDCADHETDCSKVPPLYISEARVGAVEYREASIDAVSAIWDGAEISPYAPMNLQADGDQTYTAMLMKLDRDSNSRSTWIAAVFAFRDEKVERVVFAIQPWIRIVPAREQPNG